MAETTYPLRPPPYSWVYSDTTKTLLDWPTRIATVYDLSDVLLETRPFTVEENAQAEVLEAQAALEAEVTARTAEHIAIVSAIAATTQEKPGGGAAWTQPTGASDAYALDAEVTHNGKTWTSLTAYNVWEPGVANWREKVSTGYPAWIQPTGAHDAYELGARVTHAGQDWESDIAANVWEPGVFGWTAIP